MTRNIKKVNKYMNDQYNLLNSLSATGDIGRQPPLLPPQLAATSRHNNS